jgi:N-acetylneuraminic acid mutarotase
LDVPKGPRPRYRAPASTHRRRHGHGVAIFTLVVLLAAVAAGAVYVERHQIKKLIEGSPAARKVLPKTTPKKPHTTGPPLMLVSATVAPWQLPVPVTEALVLTGPPGELLVAGGEVASGSSGNGAFLVNTATGKLALYANLVAGVHDTAGAVLAGEVYLFGGAGPAPTSTVQSFTAPIGQSSQTVSASATGSLPALRAGDAAVLIGATAYIVGGYDGPAADGQVLGTTDGASFAVVAKLPVPVRDAAVSATGGQIYVFGGAAVGPSGWGPVAYIQHVDPATGKTALVGRLPTPLEGAVAFNLSGRLYVAGGHGPAGWNSTIYGFEPATGKLVAAGHLPHAVSGAGATVVSGVAWLLGGDSASGMPSGWVQTIRLTSRPAIAAATAPAGLGAPHRRGAGA